ncbi:hypothetical protein R6Q59_023040 [Mikania micrantha]
MVSTWGGLPWVQVLPYDPGSESSSSMISWIQDLFNLWLIVFRSSYEVEESHRSIQHADGRGSRGGRLLALCYVHSHEVEAVGSSDAMRVLHAS